MRIIIDGYLCLGLPVSLIFSVIVLASCTTQSRPEHEGSTMPEAPSSTPGSSAAPLPTLQPATAVGATALSCVAFLAGSWVSRDGPRLTDETWSFATGERPGSMIGSSRTVSGDRTLFFENLRIEARPDGVFYLASPMGREPATPFKLVASSKAAVTFDNPAHDYPTRISYRLEDTGSLIARIEGTKNGSPSSAQWVYTRRHE